MPTNGVSSLLLPHIYPRLWLGIFSSPNLETCDLHPLSSKRRTDSTRPDWRKLVSKCSLLLSKDSDLLLLLSCDPVAIVCDVNFKRLRRKVIPSSITSVLTFEHPPLTLSEGWSEERLSTTCLVELLLQPATVAHNVAVSASTIRSIFQRFWFHSWRSVAWGGSATQVTQSHEVCRIKLAMNLRDTKPSIVVANEVVSAGTIWEVVRVLRIKSSQRYYLLRLNLLAWKGHILIYFSRGTVTSFYSQLYIPPQASQRGGPIELDI